MENLEYNLRELQQSELLIHGGGLFYDIYRVVVAEGEDFVQGFLDGLHS